MAYDAEIKTIINHHNQSSINEIDGEKKQRGNSNLWLKEQNKHEGEIKSDIDRYKIIII